MEWLSQNWIWLTLGIGVIFMMSRGGHGGHGGCCAGSGHERADKDGGTEAPTGAASGGAGHQHH